MIYMHLLLLCCYSTYLLSECQLDTYKQGLNEFAQKNFQIAEAFFLRALDQQPQDTDIMYHIACCYYKNNRVDLAKELLHKLIDIDPLYNKAYHLLIELLKSDNTQQTTIEHLYRSLLEHYPDDVKAHSFLAQRYKNREEFDQAIAHYRHIIRIEKNNYVVLFELALLYTLLGQVDDAVALYDKILQAYPTCIPAIYNKGYALKMKGACDQAIVCYKTALSLDPEYNEAQFALGMAYLSKGDYQQGWTEHVHFLKRMKRNGDNIRMFLATGTAKDKTVLLLPEGGLGDSINFVRYALELKKYGFRTIVAVQKELYLLFKNCPGIDVLIPLGSNPPAYDDHTTLMSIPAILYAHEHSLPTFQQYIFPDPQLMSSWKNYFKEDTSFKIGICWEASVYNDSSRPPVARRGMPLETLYILSEIEGISLYSLQQLDGVEQLNNVPSYINIHVFDKNFDKTNGSFMDTAAVMCQMDLIISVDTAIAHLAGALGRPIWLMLPFATDWRWIAHRTTSDWYPTMRIFQQPNPFDWKSVINTIFWELMTLVNKHKKDKEFTLT